MVLRSIGALVGLVVALAAPASALALGDTTPPESTANPPAFATGPSFDIPYTASDDLGGSGVARVDLYVKAPGDPSFSIMPVATDTTPDTPSFTYTPTAGDGQYAFYTVATDNDGNSELPPLTPDGMTTVDSTPPSSSASAPATAGSGPINVTYTADDGSGTGVASVELWAKAPGDSSYSLADTDSSPDTPSFSYTPSGGDGTYSFYTVAVDQLGNREAAPAAPDAQTAVDTTAPSSSASAPATSGSGPVAITYTADDAGGSGVASVELWAKAPGDSSYSLADTDTTPASPSFSYSPSAGDGSYSFYTVAVDAVGNREQAPSQADAQTTVDTTAPTSSASAPARSGSGAINVTYTASDTGGTGVASVELWAKAPGSNSYSLAATDASPGTPSFSYTPSAGDGTYSFYTVAVDTVGNREQSPSQPDAQTAVDTTAPTSSASAPASAGSGPVTVTYSASDSGGSGVASVELWAKAPGDSSYSLADTDTTPASPSFSYTPSSGDGTYRFYTIAVDALGNREAAPATPDAQTAVDTTAPTSTASAPASSGSGPISVTYTASDTSGSGVASVELWVKAPGDASFSKAATDTSPASPSFSYSPTAGDGTYSFYTVAVDALGNREAAPASPDAQTKVDTTPPSSSASAPATASSGPIAVTYTAGDGSGVGVTSVELWVKRPGDSSYSLAGTDTSPSSASFSYTPNAGDGTYSFYTVAIDAIGNREQAPSQADTQTLLDTTAPTSTASSPAVTGIGTFSVTYTTSDGSGSGVQSVELWAQAPGDSGFSKVATDTSPDSPSFSYNPTAGDGTYSFYTVAVDALGNREQAPSQPDTQTTRDTNAPGSTASAPAATAGGPIDVSYVVGGNGIASVELWAKAPGDSGYSLADTDTTPDTPSFTYNPAAGDGTYSFYTVAVDNVGNREAAPADPDTQTKRDTAAPTSSASAPASVGSGSFTVNYSADDGSGTGVSSVELWAQAPGDTGFSKVATDDTPASPSFDYSPSAGDGTYYFYTVAVDAVGNREAVPATADTHTVRNTAAPPSPPPSSDPPAPIVAQLPAQASPTAAPSSGATQQPSLPLVAAVSMPGKQTIRSVLKNGLRLKLYVYRQVRLSVSMTLVKRSATQLKMLRQPMVARKTFDFAKPAVYELRLRVLPRAVTKLRRAKSATFALKTVLTGSSGSSTSKSQLMLRRG